MDNIAIIAAAGWKGGGKNLGLPYVPMPFIKLVDDSTTISRISGKLTSREFRVIIAVGAIGYPFRSYQQRGGFFMEQTPIDEMIQELGVTPGGSPWTREIHQYAARYGELAIMPEPGWTNQHDTFCRILDTMSDYHKVLLIQGDILLADVLWDQLFQWEPSFQFVPCPNHSIFLLKGNGLSAYRERAEMSRKRPTDPSTWNDGARAYPDGAVGSGYLQHNGVKLYGWNHTPWRLMDTGQYWLDIDNGANYNMANERIEKGLL